MLEVMVSRSEIGARLRDLREARRWTQAELAQRLAMSQPQVSQVERGLASLSAEQLLEALRVFNVTADHFAPSLRATVDVALGNAIARLGASQLRADHEVHRGHLFQKDRSEALRHAAHHPEDHPGVLVPLELPDPANDPLLGVVAHGTGVDQHDVGALGLGRLDIALTREDTEHQLSVRHVHLAAVGLDPHLLHGRGVRLRCPAGRKCQG